MRALQDFVVDAGFSTKRTSVAKSNMPITFNRIVKTGPLPAQRPLLLEGLSCLCRENARGVRLHGIVVILGA